MISNFAKYININLNSLLLTNNNNNKKLNFLKG